LSREHARPACRNADADETRWHARSSSVPCRLARHMPELLHESRIVIASPGQSHLYSGVRPKRPIDHARPLESLNRRRDRADPQPRGDERDRRLDVRRTAGHTRNESGSTAECHDLIVEGRCVIGRTNDELLRRKIRRVDDCPACKRVVAWQRDDEGLSRDGLITEPRIGDLGANESDVYFSVDQCLPLLHRPQILDSELDVRESLPEHPDDVRQRLVRRGSHVPHDELAELATLGAPCGTDGTLGIRESLLRLHEKCLPGRRQLDTPLGPTKQAGAQLILETLYLLTQRRLRDVKPRGRPAEMQLFRNCEKGAEVSQLHGRNDISRRISRVRIDIGRPRISGAGWRRALDGT
jgi:hypothetical protein